MKEGVAAVGRGASCELLGSGGDVGDSGKRASAEHAISQVVSARTNLNGTVWVWDLTEARHDGLGTRETIVRTENRKTLTLHAMSSQLNSQE